MLSKLASGSLGVLANNAPVNGSRAFSYRSKRIDFTPSKCCSDLPSLKPLSTHYKTNTISQSRFLSTAINVPPRVAAYLKPHWASYDIPVAGKGGSDYVLRGYVNGQWVNYPTGSNVVDPLHKDESLFYSPKLSADDLTPYVNAAKSIPRSGLFNLYKHPERYLEIAKVMAKVARELHDPSTEDYFVRLIQLTMPKSRPQALAEVRILRLFLENFSGDRVRMLMRGFTQAGDRAGQVSNGLRFPFGATAVVAPFNFPLEIVAMQALGSLMVGNYTFIKAGTAVAVVMEAFLELLLHCGLDPSAVAFFPGGGADTEKILTSGEFRATQFTGSTHVGEKLVRALGGRVKLEDAGFDVKILGPDVPKDKADCDYVSWQCDQDAYAISGQKCSAQSFMAVHKNWLNGHSDKDIEMAPFIRDLAARSSKRNLHDLSLGPLLGESPASCRNHIDMLMSLPGARLLFGGGLVDPKQPASPEADSVRPGGSYSIHVPEKYAILEPTAIHVPLSTLRSLPRGHPAFSELFGALQLITTYESNELPQLIALIDSFSHHLTSGVVSNDPEFLNTVLGGLIHGVTYAGNRARTTGAPQNHWFGPAGDPLGAGIGTPEAILHTWTCHREVIMDQGPTKDISTSQS